MAVRESIKARATKLCISRPPTFSDFNETKRHDLAYRWSNRVTVYSKIDEVGIRDRQTAIVGAAMISKLDLDSLHHTSRR
jgi:hypothetical protein